MKLTILPEDKTTTAGATTLALGGEVDLATAGDLEAEVERLVATGTTQIVLDLRNVTFCDSVGLNVLVRARHRCESHGGWMRITHPRGEVAQVLHISGLLDHLAAEEI